MNLQELAVPQLLLTTRCVSLQFYFVKETVKETKLPFL